MKPSFGLALVLFAVAITNARAETPASQKSLADQPALDQKIRSATAAIEQNPADKDSYLMRARLYVAAGDSERAMADYDRVLKLDPQWAVAYDERGSLYFTLGHVNESIDDFDRYLKLKPQQEPWHWKRGISYYYADRWDDGRRQFEGYQTVDDNDVENAVWRYLCMARGTGVAQARDALLKIKQDGRVPMMEVYSLYGGKARPEDVLTAAQAGSPSPEALNSRLFYAHLYLGLYYEAAGDRELAKKHITTARTHKIGHYMWNVADVHEKLLAGEPTKP